MISKKNSLLYVEIVVSREACRCSFNNCICTHKFCRGCTTKHVLKQNSQVIKNKTKQAVLFFKDLQNLAVRLRSTDLELSALYAYIGHTVARHRNWVVERCRVAKCHIYKKTWFFANPGKNPRYPRFDAKQHDIVLASNVSDLPLILKYRLNISAMYVFRAMWAMLDVYVFPRPVNHNRWWAIKCGYTFELKASMLRGEKWFISLIAVF